MEGLSTSLVHRTWWKCRRQGISNGLITSTRCLYIMQLCVCSGSCFNQGTGPTRTADVYPGSIDCIYSLASIVRSTFGLFRLLEKGFFFSSSSCSCCFPPYIYSVDGPRRRWFAWSNGGGSASALSRHSSSSTRNNPPSLLLFSCLFSVHLTLARRTITSLLVCYHKKIELIYSFSFFKKNRNWWWKMLLWKESKNVFLFELVYLFIWFYHWSFC